MESDTSHVMCSMVPGTEQDLSVSFPLSSLSWEWTRSSLTERCWGCTWAQGDIPVEYEAWKPSAIIQGWTPSSLPLHSGRARSPAHWVCYWCWWQVVLGDLPGGHEWDGSIRQLLKEHLLEFSLPTWSWEVEVGSSVSSAVDLMKCSSLQKPKCLVDFLRGNDTK